MNTQRGKRLACGAVFVAFAAALLAACTTSPTPPFDLSESRPETVLDVVEWLGSLGDLTQAAVVTAGLGLAAKRENYVSGQITTILELALLAPGLQVFSYRVFNPPLQTPDGLKRADIELVLGWTGSPICITKKMFEQRFGSPVGWDVITDGGGRNYQYRMGHWWSPWHTVIGTRYWPNEERGCVPQIFIDQRSGSGTGL